MIRCESDNPVRLLRNALPASFAAAAAEWAQDKPGLGERPVRTRPTLLVRRALLPDIKIPDQSSAGHRAV